MSFFTINKIPTMTLFKDVKMGEVFYHEKKEYVKINDTCGLCVDDLNELNILQVGGPDFKVQKTGTAKINVEVRRTFE